MSGIICAVRGGPNSQPTIDKAISLAKEVSLPLYFLYIVNLNFLVHTQSSRVSTISEELSKMGEFILLTAQDKANQMGVAAEGVVRQGDVQEEIILLAQELEANYVILGLPQGQKEADIFVPERIKEFSALIEQESGAKVVLAEGKPSE
ncbi:MAG: universal stress protein [Chloroflexota bacterium]